MTSLEALERRLAYSFHDRTRLERALTHKSVGRDNNERLEFLGDAVLGCVVAERLYAGQPDADEHALTLQRAALVKKATLAAVARSLKLGECLRIGAGERKSGGRNRDSILADAFEAVIGAIAEEAGYRAAAEVVATVLQPWFERIDGEGLKDPKTRLQELLQRRRLERPRYEVLDVGGDAHTRRFRVACFVDELDVSSEGCAASRREAEKIAARSVLEQLSE